MNTSKPDPNPPPHRDLWQFLQRPLFGTVVVPTDARVDPQHFPEDEFPVHCPRCDYLLRGLTAERCPECGDPFDRGQLLVHQYAIRAAKGWRAPEQRTLLVLGVIAILLVVLKPAADYLFLKAFYASAMRAFELYTRILRGVSAVLLVALSIASFLTWKRWRLRTRHREAILRHLGLRSLTE